MLTSAPALEAAVKPGMNVSQIEFDAPDLICYHPLLMPHVEGNQGIALALRTWTPEMFREANGGFTIHRTANAERYNPLH
jgi:hypothetical protein